jgi:hypothetical protein
MPRAKIHVMDLFYNPKNNLRQANQNLVDHLSADIQALGEQQDVRTLVTYRLTERLAYAWAREITSGAAFDHYQFELRLITPMRIPPLEEVVLVSPAIAVKPNDN